MTLSVSPLQVKIWHVTVAAYHSRWLVDHRCRVLWRSRIIASPQQTFSSRRPRGKATLVFEASSTRMKLSEASVVSSYNVSLHFLFSPLEWSIVVSLFNGPFELFYNVYVSVYCPSVDVLLLSAWVGCLEGRLPFVPQRSGQVQSCSNGGCPEGYECEEGNKPGSKVCCGPIPQRIIYKLSFCEQRRDKYYTSVRVMSSSPLFLLNFPMF